MESTCPHYVSNYESTPIVCDYELNSKGLCPNKDNHINDEPVTDVLVMPKISDAKRKDTNLKNAGTWLKEAERHIECAARYYRTSAEWFTKSGQIEDAELMRSRAESLENVKEGELD